MIDEICRGLGVPAAVFRGSECTDLASYQFELMDRARLERLRRSFSERVVLRLVEKSFPELFWEPFFLFGCGQRSYVRRKDPIRITFE